MQRSGAEWRFCDHLKLESAQKLCDFESRKGELRYAAECFLVMTYMISDTFFVLLMFKTTDFVCTLTLATCTLNLNKNTFANFNLETHRK